LTAKSPPLIVVSERASSQRILFRQATYPPSSCFPNVPLLPKLGFSVRILLFFLLWSPSPPPLRQRNKVFGFALSSDAPEGNRYSLDSISFPFPFLSLSFPSSFLEKNTLFFSPVKIGIASFAPSSGYRKPRHCYLSCPFRCEPPLLPCRSPLQRKRPSIGRLTFRARSFFMSMTNPSVAPPVLSFHLSLLAAN